MSIEFIKTNGRMDELIQRLIELEKKVKNLEAELQYTRSMLGGV